MAGAARTSVDVILVAISANAKVPTAKVSLRRTDGQVRIDVEDRGVGFDPTALGDRAAPGGFGLLSVREQISRLGGTLEIESALQQGTRVTLRVPLQAESGAGMP